MNEKYLVLKENPFSSPTKKRKKTKRKQGKIRRLQQKIDKLNKPGFGKKWEGKQIWYRIELALEDSEGNRENEQIHWISVREFAKKEREFYRQYMLQNGKDLKPGELVETQYLLSYLEDYYQQNKERLNVNTAFIFPASKKGDKYVKYPLVQRIWGEDFKLREFNEGIAAVYQTTIWHEIEDKGDR